LARASTPATLKPSADQATHRCYRLLVAGIAVFLLFFSVAGDKLPIMSAAIVRARGDCSFLAALAHGFDSTPGGS